MILLTSELGFRIGEILGIDYTKDIDYENHEIRVDFRDDNENDARAKNAEERRGRVSDDTFEFLLYYIGEYWDILQKQEYLFINIKGDTIGKPLRVDSVYDMFERMEKKTGIKITPHMLRRYYAKYEMGSRLASGNDQPGTGTQASRYNHTISECFRRQAENSKSGILPPIFQTLRSRTVFGKQEVKMNAGKYICLAAGRTGR